MQIHEKSSQFVIQATSLKYTDGDLPKCKANTKIDANAQSWSYF